MQPLGVKYGDSNDKHKTIHKSKGEEFDNVFVILKDEDDIEFLLSWTCMATMCIEYIM